MNFLTFTLKIKEMSDIKKSFDDLQKVTENIKESSENQKRTVRQELAAIWHILDLLLERIENLEKSMEGKTPESNSVETPE